MVSTDEILKKYERETKFLEVSGIRYQVSGFILQKTMGFATLFLEETWLNKEDFLND